VLTVTVLLFAVVLTHGLNGDGVEGHLVTSAVVPVTMSSETALHAADDQTPLRPAATGEAHEGRDPSHPSEHCVSGLPQQGPVLTPPCFAPSVSESASLGRALGKRSLNAPGPSLSSPTALRSSVVQQV